MIILDHNIPEDQAEQLRRWRVHFRQIGFEVGRPEWDDQQEILRYLQTAKQVTFFTRDLGFFRRRLCHRNYCLVVLAVPVLKTALYIRGLLRHSAFKTRAKRQGKVLRVSADNVAFWQAGQERLIRLRW
ncbi:MAG: hypothetical protein HYY65_01635 [Candidatus Tectomicrobia bacterium]|uniref:Uncharacterized protein n=1 Tax=Tectimicrobiota bacterium TaxID=2528274 RepID=A0A932LZ25_UNCTE|nr:hypothetical protein [Candidatus Tectomicrobia bacterium]